VNEKALIDMLLRSEAQATLPSESSEEEGAEEQEGE
jgi:hypothetical protein